MQHMKSKVVVGVQSPHAGFSLFHCFFVLFAKLGSILWRRNLNLLEMGAVGCIT